MFYMGRDVSASLEVFFVERSLGRPFEIAKPGLFLIVSVPRVPERGEDRRTESSRRSRSRRHFSNGQ